MNNRFEQFERITREKEGFIKEMGMELLALEEGYCKGRIVLKEKHTNPMGSAHGGLVFALADTIGGMAAMSYGDNVVTLNASVCFLNPAIDTEYIDAEATVIRNGRTTEIYDVMVRTTEEVDIAKVTLTYYKVM